MTTVNKTNLSEHNILTVTTDVSKQNEASKRNLDFDQFNFFSDSVCWESLKQDLSDVDWAQQMKDFDPVDQYNTFMKMFAKSEKPCPTKEKCGNCFQKVHVDFTFFCNKFYCFFLVVFHHIFDRKPLDLYSFP